MGLHYTSRLYVCLWIYWGQLWNVYRSYPRQFVLQIPIYSGEMNFSRFWYVNSIVPIWQVCRTEKLVINCIWRSINFFFFLIGIINFNYKSKIGVILSSFKTCIKWKPSIFLRQKKIQELKLLFLFLVYDQKKRTKYCNPSFQGSFWVFLYSYIRHLHNKIPPCYFFTFKNLKMTILIRNLGGGESGKTFCFRLIPDQIWTYRCQKV